MLFCHGETLRVQKCIEKEFFTEIFSFQKPTRLADGLGFESILFLAFAGK